MKIFRFFISILGIMMAGYLFLAYLVLPWSWRHEERNRIIKTDSRITYTKEGIHGDPLNVGLIGTLKELIQAMQNAGWVEAKPLSVKTGAKMIVEVVARHPYPEAPVSTLYYGGRKQDLAFEKPLGHTPRQRHHVRFWRLDHPSPDGRSFWIGAVTLDTGYEASGYTGEITHHIDPDVDAERDFLMADLEKAGQLARLYQICGVGMTLYARNGEGDYYYTDGEISVGVISPNNVVGLDKPEILDNPPAVAFKNRIWKWIKRLISGGG